MYCLLPARTPLFIATRRFAVRRNVPIGSRAPLSQHTATTCVHVSGCRVPARACCNQRCRGRCNRAVCVATALFRVANALLRVAPQWSLAHRATASSRTRTYALLDRAPLATLQHCNIATLQHCNIAAGAARSVAAPPAGQSTSMGSAHCAHVQAPPGYSALRCASWAEQCAPCCATTARRRRPRRRRA